MLPRQVQSLTNSLMVHGQLKMKSARSAMVTTKNIQCVRTVTIAPRASPPPKLCHHHLLVPARPILQYPRLSSSSSASSARPAPYAAEALRARGTRDVQGHGSVNVVQQS